MILSCECGAKLKIADEKISAAGTRIRCPRCASILTAYPPPPPAIDRTPTPPPRAPKPAPAPARAPSAAPVVLVAHENEAERTMVLNILEEQGFIVETAGEGMEALRKAVDLRPAVMLLDVGLPGIYGFELCERLKGEPQTAAIKVMLITSTYDVSRYKRSPASLYGADDYIEKHEIPDYLALKVRKLLFPEEYRVAPAPAAAPPEEAAPPQAPPELETPLFSPSSLMATEPEPAQSARAEAPGAALPRSWPGDSLEPAQAGSELTPESFSLDTSIFQTEQSEMPRVNEKDPEAIEKARRFARIIVSDIALYNQEAVRDGIRNGTFYEMLKDDIEEGKRLYEARVPGSLRAGKDYYQEAFDHFIEAQKKIVR